MKDGQDVLRNSRARTWRSWIFMCWAAVQMHCQNSCQSRFAGVYLIFEVFQGIWARHSHKDNPSVSWNAPLSCPFMPSNYANCHLVPISFLSWPCLGLFGLVVSFLVYRRASWIVEFQNKVTHFCLCLVRIKMLLLMYDFSLLSSGASRSAPDVAAMLKTWSKLSSLGGNADKSCNPENRRKMGQK